MQFAAVTHNVRGEGEIIFSLFRGKCWITGNSRTVYRSVNWTVRRFEIFTFIRLERWLIRPSHPALGLECSTASSATESSLEKRLMLFLYKISIDEGVSKRMVDQLESSVDLSSPPSEPRFARTLFEVFVQPPLHRHTSNHTHTHTHTQLSSPGQLHNTCFKCPTNKTNQQIYCKIIQFFKYYRH